MKINDNENESAKLVQFCIVKNICGHDSQSQSAMCSSEKYSPCSASAVQVQFMQGTKSHHMDKTTASNSERTTFYTQVDALSPSASLQNASFAHLHVAGCKL